MIDKLLKKLSLTKVMSRRFIVFIVGVIMISLGKIDSFSFITLCAIYIGCGTIEKIYYLRNGNGKN